MYQLQGNGRSASENFRPAMPAPPLLPRRVFVGAIITSKSVTDLRIIERGILGVGTGGVIRFVQDLDQLEAEEIKAQQTSSLSDGYSTSTAVSDASKRPGLPSEAPALSALEMPPSAIPINPPPSLSPAERLETAVIKKVVEKYGWRYGQYNLVRINPGSFICPGFIDTHTHACQVPNIGLGQQYELLDWLQHVTFPRETRFEDARYARKTYESVVQRLIDSGTTTACYYATLHLEASKILAEICNERGQRAFVGKCQMDRNSPIDYVEKNASKSIQDTKEFIQFCRSLRPYGHPPDISSPRLTPFDTTSNISPEMEASIARLTATMDEIMSGRESKPPSESGSSPISHKFPLKHSPVRSKTPVSARNGSTTNLKSLSGSSTPSRQREKELANLLVQPILTPRFAIACTDAMLTGISALLARDPTLRVQTHLSENEGEITFTKKLFPFAKNYTSVYDHYSLLGSRTILAHAVHLDSDELEIIKKRKCGISHCPTSNLNLRSGASRVGEMLNMGIKVGLGTDVSGGFGLGMLSAIREASIVAKMLAFHNSSQEAVKKQEEEEARGVTSTKDAAVDGRYPRPPVEGQYKPRKPSSIPNLAATAAASATATAAATAIGGSAIPLPLTLTTIEPTPAAPSVPSTHTDAAATIDPNAKPDFTKGPLTIATLFYLATLGGAEVCSMASKIGSLEAGKEFDALLVHTTSQWGPSGYTGNPGCFVEEDDTLDDVFEKWLFTGDDRNIGTVFVRGRVVGGARPLRD